MKKLNKTNANQTQIGEKVIFYLLRDFQTQTSLTKIIKPEYNKQKVHPTIQFYFSMFKDSCEIKEIESSQTIRKGDSIPYKKKLPGFRMKVSEYLKHYTSINLSQRSLKIIETLCYPKAMRNNIFDEKFFEEFRNIERVFSQYFSDIFFSSWSRVVSKLIRPINIEGRGRNFWRNSIVDFDKKINKNRTAEELSRVIFNRITCGTPNLASSQYAEAFYDEDFCFELLEGMNNLLLIRDIEERIMFARNDLFQRMEDRSKKRAKEDIRDYETSERLYKRIEQLVNKQEKPEVFISNEDFIPKQNQREVEYPYKSILPEI